MKIYVLSPNGHFGNSSDWDKQRLLGISMGNCYIGLIIDWSEELE